MRSRRSKSRRLRSRVNLSLTQKAKNAYINYKLNKVKKQLDQEIQKGSRLKAKRALMTKNEDRIDVLQHKIKQLQKKLLYKSKQKECYAKRLSKKREEKKSRRQNSGKK